MKVSKYILFALAGALWTFAGSMVLSMGLPALIKCWTWYWLFSAIAVFLVFYLTVFSVLVRKHEQRIQNDFRPKKLSYYGYYDDERRGLTYEWNITAVVSRLFLFRVGKRTVKLWYLLHCYCRSI